MTKQLQKDKKFASESSINSDEKSKNQLIDIEIEANIHMKPKTEYPIKVKISKIEKAKPNIDIRQFEQFKDI